MSSEKCESSTTPSKTKATATKRSCSSCTTRYTPHRCITPHMLCCTTVMRLQRLYGNRLEPEGTSSHRGAAADRSQGKENTPAKTHLIISVSSGFKDVLVKAQMLCFPTLNRLLCTTSPGSYKIYNSQNKLERRRPIRAALCMCSMWTNALLLYNA